MTIGKFAKTSNTLFKGTHIGPGDHPVKPDPNIHVKAVGPDASKVPALPSNQFFIGLNNPFAKNPYQRPQASPLLNMSNPFANKANKIGNILPKPRDISGLVGKNQTPPVHTPQPSEKWMLDQIRKHQEFNKAIKTTELPRFNWK